MNSWVLAQTNVSSAVLTEMAHWNFVVFWTKFEVKFKSDRAKFFVKNPVGPQMDPEYGF